MIIESDGRRGSALRRHVHRSLGAWPPCSPSWRSRSHDCGERPRQAKRDSARGRAGGGACNGRPAYGAISNGTLRASINLQGHIDAIVDGAGLGLEFLATGGDALIPRCWCGRWGVADRTLGVAGYASIANGGESPNPDGDRVRRHRGQRRLDGRDRREAARPARVPAVATARALSGRPHSWRTSALLPPTSCTAARSTGTPPTRFHEYVTFAAAHPRLLDSTDNGSNT